MKYLKLKFVSARLVKEKSKKNELGSNRFFYPINTMHVYNSICVLLDRTPKPQLRKTDDKYLPIYDDVLKAVSDGYIKIKLMSDAETMSTVKKDWDSNLREAHQYTWKDCSYVTGTLLPIFISRISIVLDKSVDNIKKMCFDDVINEIRNKGVSNEKGEISYTDENINSLINWCKKNQSTPISNYIENKQITSKPFGFGKRVHRGSVNVNRYSGIIYMPLTNELYEELVKYTKGFSTILDGGLLTIINYGFITEDELLGFTKINDLNPIRKFGNNPNKGVVWSDTIYKDLKPGNLTEEINKIIDSTGVSIVNNKKEYDEMMKKINNIKFNGEKIGDIAYKINYFIENAINKLYI